MSKKNLCVHCGTLIRDNDVFEDLEELSATGNYKLVVCRNCARHIEYNMIDINQLIGEC